MSIDPLRLSCLSNNIHYLRTEILIESVEDFAKHLGITRQTVYKWEREKRITRLDYMAIKAHLYDLYDSESLSQSQIAEVLTCFGLE